MNSQQRWWLAQRKADPCEPPPLTEELWTQEWLLGEEESTFLRMWLQWMSLIHSSIWAAQSGVDRLLNAENKEDRKLEGKCGGGSGSGRSYREELGVNTTVNIGREKHPELKINLKITLYHFLEFLNN